MFALRTSLTAIAALYTAMWLQLDVPQWAMWTVVVISPPSRGDLLRKTVARLIGTPIGCVAAVVFAGVFGQDGICYTLALAVWVGACGFAAVWQRGYVAYGALLAGFTAAIVGTGTSAAPIHAFISALDRGSSVIVGVIFALVGAVIVSHSDDVPTRLVAQICKAACSLLDWADLMLAADSVPTEDAPHSGALLQLDTSILNANAERRALRRLRPWVSGIPTALLAIQSSVLELRQRHAQSAADNESLSRAALRVSLARLGRVLRMGDKNTVASLREESVRLAKESESLNPAAKETMEAAAYVVSGLEAILTMQRPALSTRSFPPPAFSPEWTKAWAAFVRAVVGICAAYLFWNATSWQSGPTLVTYTATALIIMISIEDPLRGLQTFIPGSLAGSIVGVAALYLLLPLSDSFLWLAIVTVPLLGISVWILAAGGPPAMSLAYGNSLVTAMQIANPQRYGLTQSIDAVIAQQVSTAIVLALFFLIDPGGHGQDRVRHTLKVLRGALATAQLRGPRANRNERLKWETRAYDEIRHIHTAKGDLKDRRAAVHLLLAGRAALRRKSLVKEF